MSSSREPDGRTNRDAVLAAEAAERRAFRRRLIGFAVFLVVAAAAGIGFLEWRARSDAPLVEARGLLAGVVGNDNPAQRVPAARRAEELLRNYLRAGKRTSSGKLLLASALVLQVRKDVPPEAGMASEVAALLAAADPGQCAVDELTLASRVLAGAGRLGDADRLLETALAMDATAEQREELLRTAADVRSRLGRDDAAIEHCKELAELRPDDPYPLRLLGMIYERMRLPDQVARVDRKLLALAPDDAVDVRLRLIENLVATGQAGEARREHDRLRRQAPDAAARNPLLEARLLHAEGKANRALALLEPLLAQKQPDPEVLLLAGRIRLAQGEADRAIGLLEKLVAFDASYEEAHYLLGTAYGQKGDAERAKKHLAEHRRVLDTKVKIYKLERQAVRDDNPKMRDEIVRLYNELGWRERATAWQGGKR